MQLQPLGLEDLLEEGIATCSNILAWRIPWTEEPGGLQSTGLQRVGHDWVTSCSLSYLKLTLRNMAYQNMLWITLVIERKNSNCRYLQSVLKIPP